MDGLTLTAVAAELNVLVGGRIDKLQQPERDELLLSVHSAVGNFRLLISASPVNCRISLTDEKRISPVDAPVFVMLLRKHLLGGRITAVAQPNMDRIIELYIEAYTELHDLVTYRLVCEIMGRHSNIILVDNDNNIVDSIRRIPPSMSTARLVLPHVAYEYPPSRVKNNPSQATSSDFATAIESSSKPENSLSDSFYSLSPAVAKLLLQAVGYPGRPPAATAESVKRFFSSLSNGVFSPCIIMSGDTSVCTLPFLPAHGVEYTAYNTMCDAVNSFYRLRALEEGIKRRTAVYDRIIRNAVQKLERKLAIYADSIESEEKIEQQRLYGELLTANLHILPQRSNTALVHNYYADPIEAIEIPLDPLLSPADNAQRYYLRYRKAIKARTHALEMRKQVVEELSYLDELTYTLSLCEGDAELNELRDELAHEGYIHVEGGKSSKAKQKPAASKPYSFVSSDGIKLLVGKNNKQNDMLTLSIAMPDETWLHTKAIHGSHVIIKSSGDIPAATLYDAAMLAAYYSKARGSENIPVDYTLVKYVKKPSGARPGMVVYTHQRTVYVTPDIEHIQALK